MHEQKIAHRRAHFEMFKSSGSHPNRDCTYNNIMMDASPMYTKPFHPVEQHMRRDWKGRAHHYSRTKRPPKYYWIDFGFSLRFDQLPALHLPQGTGDQSVPEHQPNKFHIPCDPFATDIYFLGNLIRLWFIQVSVVTLALYSSPH